MKRLAFGILMCAVAAFGAAACDDDNPTEPSNQPVIFTSQLSAANEVPAITGAEANARGSVTITFNLTRDAAGAITGGTASFNAPLTGFPAPTNINLAHIHIGAAGVNGTVVVNTGLTPGSPFAMPTGAGTLVADNIALTAATAEQIIANPAGFYFNAHTTLNPGGAVRGQLTRTQ
jgi:CHRD domain